MLYVSLPPCSFEHHILFIFSMEVVRSFWYVIPVSTQHIVYAVRECVSVLSVSPHLHSAAPFLYFIGHTCEKGLNFQTSE